MLIARENAEDDDRGGDDRRYECAVKRRGETRTPGADIAGNERLVGCKGARAAILAVLAC
jgi:hypothetical protein